jgi:hypothetical protein
MHHVLTLAALFAANSAHAGVCPLYDHNLGSATGVSVATGNTCGQGNDETATCGGPPASEDVSYLWTSPISGRVWVSTAGSAFDTVIHVKDANCLEVACDDNGANYPHSYDYFWATAGESYHIVVDGYFTNRCGAYQLSIDTAPIDWDGDGVIDDVDDCYGDDAMQDGDLDGWCTDTDTDFSVSSTFAGAGVPFTVTATHAPPGERILFMAGSQGGWTCHPSGVVCVGAGNPRVLGSAVANGAGTASINVTPPAVLPPNVSITALWYDIPANDSDVTPWLRY